jgi:hypothetical protein
MISNDRSKSIIDILRSQQIATTVHLVDQLDISNKTPPDLVTITMDRWVLNDLNIMLKIYQKEFISNE